MRHLSADGTSWIDDQASAATPTTLPSAEQAEIAFLSGVNASGLVAATSYWTWSRNEPATYGYDVAHKWQGGAAGTAGGTVAYYFDPSSNWTAAEQQGWISALSLWSAVANIQFVQTTNPAAADVIFYRGSAARDTLGQSYEQDGSYFGNISVGGSTLLAVQPAGTYVTIDTSEFGDVDDFSDGGYGVGTVVHELGHLLGLGHAGPYNGDVDSATEQSGPYDSRLWSIMSYIDPSDSSAEYYSQYPVSGTDWGDVDQPFTWMPLDILAAQRLYGLPTTTPLSGGQVFGFNTNITGALAQYFNFNLDPKPVLTLWDEGSGNSLDLSGYATASTVSLLPGTFSSFDGMTNNLAIAYGTRIDSAIGGAGNDSFVVNGDGDTINGGGGTNTVVFTGSSDQYAIAYANGVVTVDDTVAARDGQNTLTNIKYLRFSDTTIDTSTLLLSITGARSGQATTDSAAITPFSGVTITDANAGVTETVTIALSAAANGSLSNLAGGSYNAASGIATLTGSTAAVTAALDGLVFTPTAHQVAPGGTVTTSFTITVSDVSASKSNTTTSVVATAVAATPVISGAVASQATNDAAALAPFAHVVVTDVNFGVTDTVSVTLSAPANGRLSNLAGGAFNASTGVYTVSGTAAAVTAALEGLVFTPTAHQVALGGTVTTGFTIAVNDAVATTSNATTSVVATAVPSRPVISGTVAGQAVSDTASVAPFAGAAITDATLGTSETLTVALSAPGNGALSNLGAGSYNAATGVFTVSGSPAAVSAALEGLVFTPTAHQVAPGQAVTTGFTLTATDSAGATSTDSATSVVATAAAVPGFGAQDISSGAFLPDAVLPYSGPVAGLDEQYVNITSDNLNVAVSTSNWFIHTGSGTDAIAVSGGTNVLDGGTGSNFLTGGTGTDTFFVDNRNAAADIWSSVVGFHAGDAATIWGVTPADFDLSWVDGQGAAGYSGLTLHATAAGKPTASLTLAGFSQADIASGRLSVLFGTDPASSSAYMYVYANS